MYLVTFWSLHWPQQQMGQRVMVQNYLKRKRGLVQVELHLPCYQMGEPLLI